MTNLVLEVLKEDRKTVTYRPKLAELFDSATAAILFQQILYWWGKHKGEPFYKYKEPCQSEDYKGGDSWCEELAFSRREFDNALKIFSTKIKKGMSKDDALSVVDLPTLTFVETPQQYLKKFEETIKHLVIFWTDSNRKTYYMVNEALLGKVVSALYLSKVHNVRYLKKYASNFSLKSTNVTLPIIQRLPETTNNNTADEPQSPDLVILDKGQPKEPLSKKERDEWFDAVKDVLGVNGGLNVLYQQMLRGESKRKGYKEYNLVNPITPEQFRQWGSWYRRTELKNNPALSMVRSPAKIQSSIITFLDKLKPQDKPRFSPTTATPEAIEAGERLRYKILHGEDTA